MHALALLKANRASPLFELGGEAGHYRPRSCFTECLSLIPEKEFLLSKASQACVSDWTFLD